MAMSVRNSTKEWQDWGIEQVGPFIQGLVAVQLLIYLMTLIFSYKELFGETPADEPIRLSQSEILKIEKLVERRKAAHVDISKEPTITTITFKHKKESKKNEKF